MYLADEFFHFCKATQEWEIVLDKSQNELKKSFKEYASLVRDFYKLKTLICRLDCEKGKDVCTGNIKRECVNEYIHELLVAQDPENDHYHGSTEDGSLVIDTTVDTVLVSDYCVAFKVGDLNGNWNVLRTPPKEVFTAKKDWTLFFTINIDYGSVGKKVDSYIINYNGTLPMKYVPDVVKIRLQKTWENHICKNINNWIDIIKAENDKLIDKIVKTEFGLERKIPQKD